MYIHNGKVKVICLSWLQLRLLKYENIKQQNRSDV